MGIAAKILPLALVTSWLMGGCGGAVTSDLFEPSNTLSGTEDGAVETDSSVTDAVVTKDTGARDTSTPDSSVADTSVKDASQPDTAPPETVACGTTTCDVPEVCCIGTNQQTCAPTALQCPLKTFPVPCDESKDCPNAGEICCLTLVRTSGGGARPVSVACEQAALCKSGSGGNTQRVEVCNTAQPSCKTGTCNQSNATFEGYGVCL